MSSQTILLLLGALVLGINVFAQETGAIAAVWAVNDGEKIKRDDLDNPNKAGNSAWKDGTINLFAARNEVVAFQVIVQAGPQGAKDVDVTLASLTRKDGREKLVLKPEGKDPTNWCGGQIERFTQHYLNITRATPPGWFYNKTAKPEGLTGWVPDALVPFNAKKGLGGGPFEVGANLNQGVWFDIYVPEGAPPGLYAGTVDVTAGGSAVAKLPVTLRVLDLRLPDENHFHAMIYFDDGQVQNRHGKGEDLVARYHRLAHRHRVEFTTAYRPNPDPQHLALLTGAAFIPEKGYIGPGQGVGYTIVPASFYGAGTEWKGDSAWKSADTFMTWLKKTKPEAITFLYTTDEPGPKEFPWIKEMSDHLHANTGVGKALPMFVTKGPAPGLEGAIDVWCTVTNQYNQAKAKAEREKGRRWWVYNGHRPYAGTQITDAPAVDCRVTPWACWKYDVELWFYWLANHWQHNHQYRQRGEQNVWVDPVTFGGEGGINGDGVLVYPGQDLKHPEQDRGIAGPVASIRLKNIRRGMQDYEYLWLATKNGLAAEARAAATECVPRAFDEAKGNVAWSIKGSDWDAARWKLAEALEKKLKQ